MTRNNLITTVIRACAALPRLPAGLVVLCGLLSMSPALGDASDDLFASINTRLGYMRDVALYKAAHRLPVEDLPREAIVVEDSRAAAAAAGLNADTVAAFFQAQIDMAKTIQYRQQADLPGAGAARPVADLDAEIRPALDLLGERIIALLAQSLRERGIFRNSDWPAFEHAISESYVSPREKRRLFESLLPIRPL